MSRPAPQLNREVSAQSWSVAPQSESSRAWDRFRRHRLAVAGASVLAVMVVAAVGAPWLAGHNPNTIHLGHAFAPPGPVNWLGTDAEGRDIFARVLYGARVSLSVGMLAVLIYLGIGTTLGILSGYYGGTLDSVIQRLTEVVMTFPVLLIIITVVSLVGPSLYNVFLAIGLLGWPGVTRLVRAEVLSLREREFVSAAQALGARGAMIQLRHILPNVLPPVIVAGTLGVADAILTETSLSYLGLGVQPPTPSWGSMIAAANDPAVLVGHPWVWIAPGVAIALCVLSINFLGDGIRDAIDPRVHL